MKRSSKEVDDLALEASLGTRKLTDSEKRSIKERLQERTEELELPRQTFRIDEETWVKFTAKARENGTTGSALLRDYIRKYLGD